MACVGKRAASMPPPKAIPMIGEKGFVKLMYIGSDPADVFGGQITGAAYPFDRTNPLYVDRRDAVYLMGSEFVEIEQ